MKSPIFTNAPCKTACLYNAPSMHNVDPKRPFFFKFRNAQMSIKDRCVHKIAFPPPPGKSVTLEDFLLICAVFPHFGPFSGGGGKPNFAGKNFMDTQTFLIQGWKSMDSQRLSPNVKSSATSSRKFGQKSSHPAMQQSACLKGSRTSCDVINCFFGGGGGGRQKITSRDGCVLLNLADP